jgi:hypothetical protein
VPEACADLTIVIVEIKKTDKQKTMDRTAGRTNLVAANADASITISLEHSKYVFSFSLQAGAHYPNAFEVAVNSLKNQIVSAAKF